MIEALKVHDVVKGEATAQGHTVVVDRLWPRGIAKEDLDAQDWLKGVAPSTQLRKWWDHDPQRFEEFASRYRAELAENYDDPDVERLRALAADGPVTLLFAAADREINHAVVLRDWLAERVGQEASAG
ncbi:DUF488 domain-containing protein [Corynebacterium lizhenjunii]|uniref:DUF488 domain-containing protein n=1 Tax=Corynebacterium lizhenjunii TaxID=2709394 RepID=UPI0013EABE69|nr:DUF488 family protein [Corynebacterium lizhenjunii]